MGSWSGRWKPRSALEWGQRVEALRRRQELLGKRGIVSLCAAWLLQELQCWERAGAELAQGTGRRRSLVLVPLSILTARVRTQLLLQFLGLQLCQERFSLDIRWSFFSERVVRHCPGSSWSSHVQRMAGRDTQCSLVWLTRW